MGSCANICRTAIRGVLLIGLAFLPCLASAQETGLQVLEQKDIMRVNVYRLVLDPQSSQPVVVLADVPQERALLIWIDYFEGQAIHSELEGIEHPRPLTHDLLERIIQKTNGRIHHIVITELRQNVFYAILVMERDGSLVEIDARPSDSIVMALKFKAPIYVAKSLFDEMAVSLGEHNEPEEEYGLSLQDLTPSLAEYFSYGADRGVLVSAVRKGSRAAADGMQAGDIIVEVGGRIVDNSAFLKEAFARSEVPVEARIFRKSKLLTLTLHPR